MQCKANAIICLRVKDWRLIQDFAIARWGAIAVANAYQ
jgi:hypothetical protein